MQYIWLRYVIVKIYIILYKEKHNYTFNYKHKI